MKKEKVIECEKTVCDRCGKKAPRDGFPYWGSGECSYESANGDNYRIELELTFKTAHSFVTHSGKTRRHNITEKEISDLCSSCRIALIVEYLKDTKRSLKD